MKTLLELANSYEAWAARMELIAETLAGIAHEIAPELRSTIAEQAVALIHEARAYRRDAADLREPRLIEGKPGIFKKCFEECRQSQPFALRAK